MFYFIFHFLFPRWLSLLPYPSQYLEMGSYPNLPFFYSYYFVFNIITIIIIIIIIILLLLLLLLLLLYYYYYYYCCKSRLQPDLKGHSNIHSWVLNKISTFHIILAVPNNADFSTCSILILILRLSIILLKLCCYSP